MTANWAFSPVCGVDFWRVIVTSPEVLIFLFFMITDPKTVPAGRVGRIVFGILVAVASTLLVAPQTNEFGTKVALLSGLVAICAIRPLLERFLPEPKSAADELRGFAARLATGGGGAGHGAVRGAARVGAGASSSSSPSGSGSSPPAPPAASPSSTPPRSWTASRTRSIPSTFPRSRSART